MIEFVFEKLLYFTRIIISRKVQLSHTCVISYKFINKLIDWLIRRIRRFPEKAGGPSMEGCAWMRHARYLLMEHDSRIPAHTHTRIIRIALNLIRSSAHVDDIVKTADESVELTDSSVDSRKIVADRKKLTRRKLNGLSTCL